MRSLLSPNTPRGQPWCQGRRVLSGLGRDGAVAPCKHTRARHPSERQRKVPAGAPSPRGGDREGHSEAAHWERQGGPGGLTIRDPHRSQTINAVPTGLEGPKNEVKLEPKAKQTDVTDCGGQDDAPGWQ